jgi:hypothetical protein
VSDIWVALEDCHSSLSNANVENALNIISFVLRYMEVISLALIYT